MNKIWGMCPVTVTLYQSCAGCRALLCQLWESQIENSATLPVGNHMGNEWQATGRRHIALLASGAITHIALLLSSARALMTSLLR